MISVTMGELMIDQTPRTGVPALSLSFTKLVCCTEIGLRMPAARINSTPFREPIPRCSCRRGRAQWVDYTDALPGAQAPVAAGFRRGGLPAQAAAEAAPGGLGEGS